MSNPFKRLGCHVPLSQIIEVTKHVQTNYGIGAWIKGKAGNGHPPYYYEIKTYPPTEWRQWDRDYAELRGFLKLSKAMRGES